MEVPMAMGRPKAALVLDAEQRQQLNWKALQTHVLFRLDWCVGPKLFC
jgi:hypothetical protein